jgi:hypothetical protein
MERVFIKEEIHMANKLVKIFPTSLAPGTSK